MNRHEKHEARMALFEKKAEGPCDLWEGKFFRNGYGRINLKRGGKWTASNAHRAIYDLICGPIPDDAVVDHLCHNPACVNVDHLQLLSNAENAARKLSAVKTHCANGHELAGENLRIRPNGRRCCKKCQLNAALANRAAMFPEQLAAKRVRDAANARRRRAVRTALKQEQWTCTLKTR